MPLALYFPFFLKLGFPDGSLVKNPVANVGDRIGDRNASILVKYHLPELTQTHVH